MNHKTQAFKFKDLIFKNHIHMINSHHVFDNEWEISVSAGIGPYCEPREQFTDPEACTSFEVAIFNPEGDFGTNEVLQTDDDVVGWQSREDINNIIEKIHTL